MLDHTGRRRVRYEDAFRALGNYLDEQRFAQIAVIETPQGFLIKGYMAVDGKSENFVSVPTTYLFSNEDIDTLLESAYQRRRSDA